MTTMNTASETRVFSMEQLIKIPTEQVARYAYELTPAFRNEFPSESLFIARWAGMRRQHGMSVPAGIVESLMLRVEQEWNEMPALREEFSDVGLYRAFVKADAMGNVRIAGRR